MTSTKFSMRFPPKLAKAVEMRARRYGQTVAEYFRELARKDTGTDPEPMPQGFASMRKKDVVAAAKKGGRKKD